jgi:aminopeptidase N
LPGENLTRLEAADRAKLLKVHSYEVELDLTQGDETFSSRTTVLFDAHEVGASTFIDAITAKVRSISLNGESLDVAKHSDGIRIELTNLQSKNELIVDADAFYMNTGEGLHRFVDPVDNEVYLYTQFEVPDSRRMFAAFEQPDLKATFEFHVTAPSNWQVISNSPSPEPIVLDGHNSEWRFAPTPRISSYITALIAGPYSVWRDELTSLNGKTIPLGVFCRGSLAQ